MIDPYHWFHRKNDDTHPTFSRLCDQTSAIFCPCCLLLIRRRPLHHFESEPIQTQSAAGFRKNNESPYHTVTLSRIYLILIEIFINLILIGIFINLILIGFVINLILIDLLLIHLNLIHLNLMYLILIS